VRETSELGSCHYVGGGCGWLVVLLGTPASSALEQMMHRTLPDSRSRITCACAFFFVFEKNNNNKKKNNYITYFRT
jgi:hypothetical protein